MLHKYNSLPSKFVDMNGKYGKKKMENFNDTCLVKLWCLLDFQGHNNRKFERVSRNDGKKKKITFHYSITIIHFY